MSILFMFRYVSEIVMSIKKVFLIKAVFEKIGYFFQRLSDLMRIKEKIKIMIIK